jgi:cytochrome c oxidase subunit 2
LRKTLLQLAAIGILIGALVTLVAVLFQWLPTSASEEFDRIQDIFWFATVISIVIFSLVVAVVLYAVWKWRVSPDDDADGPPIHGNTKLEVIWTAIPAVLVVILGIVSAVVLSENGQAGERPLQVKAIGQQFAWKFEYGDYGGLTSGELVLPVGEQAEFTLQALDVIHSFWVPEFAQKEDVVPGITTTLVITPDRLGTFPLICTELCGLGHALMRSEAIVLKQAEFDAWAKGTSSAVSGGGAAAGKAVFEAQGCGACHTFKAAGATGKVGPDLDNLYKDAQLAGLSVPDFIRQSIVDPNAYVPPGFPKNVMPGNFGSLPKSQLDALINYLVPPSTKTVSP